MMTGDNFNLSLGEATNQRMNGITILRYADISKPSNAGGLEQYLYDLNRKLLERSNMTIIQMHTVENNCHDIQVENVGQGKLIWVPSISKKVEKPGAFDKRNVKFLIKRFLNAHIMHNQALLFLKNRFVIKNEFNLHYYSVSNERVIEMFDRYNLDLVAFHWISEDSKQVLQRAILGKIPFVMINHFDNERYKLKGVRKWVPHAAGCGGVSNANVPRYLGSKFVNLSDGIDTEFFRPDKAKPLSLGFSDPFVFMPSRITPRKGHLDVVQATALLRSWGVRAKVVFAGSEDPAAFGEELKSFIDKLGIQDNVIFVGRLSAPNLRDWYGASTVVVLPSYSEGLPRVLLEAQAMGKPVIAYDTGGVSEAMKDRETGYLVRKGNFRSLADKMRELLSSDNERIEMGRRGENFIANQFSLSGLARRHEDFYLNALSSAPGKGSLWERPE